jgi:TetR/AcrR family transcriptional repressor of lmrAB and yxaGH operons
MMSETPGSKQRMVAKAAELFRKQGYSGTGLKQIVEESGTPKGSLYFHFPGGKEELAIAAVKYACAVRMGAMQEAFDEASSAIDAVASLVRSSRDGLVASRFEDGCPIATVVLETAATSDPLQETCSKSWRTWEALFQERLREEGHDQRRAKRLATVALALMEGGMLLSRAYRSTEPLDVVQEEVENILEVEQPRERRKR